MFHSLTSMHSSASPADPNRCERAYVGNTIGQANAVSDKVRDSCRRWYSVSGLEQRRC